MNMEDINTEAALIRGDKIRTMSQLRKWCETHFFSYSIYIRDDGGINVYVPKADYPKAMTDYLAAIREQQFLPSVGDAIRIKKMTFWSLFKVYFNGGIR